MKKCNCCGKIYEKKPENGLHETEYGDYYHCECQSTLFWPNEYGKSLIRRPTLLVEGESQFFHSHHASLKEIITCTVNSAGIITKAILSCRGLGEDIDITAQVNGSDNDVKKDVMDQFYFKQREKKIDGINGI